MLEPDPTSTGDLNATFCATLVDEWIRAGVTDVVVSPGSRSTPVALAVTERPELAVHVHHDERAAGFMALGLGLASGRPAVVVTTSGTAAVELHPAVVEAHQAGVPLLAVTADRPPELRDVGAPQTVDQVHLFGRAVRWFVDPGPPDPTSSGSWRSLGARMVAEAVGSPHGPGPVHANLPFREPLVGSAGPLSAGRENGRPWHEVAVEPPAPDPDLVEWIASLEPHRPLLVAGAGFGDVDVVLAFAESTGWPVVADPRSGLRTGHPGVVTTADALLRNPAVADAMRPDLVIRMGEPAASKVLGGWLSSTGARQVAVEASGRWFDSDRSADRVARALPSDLIRSLVPLVDVPADGRWTQLWRVLETTASGAIREHLEADGVERLTDPAVANVVASALAGTDAPSTLVVSSSMPVRDLEWYGTSTGSTRVHSNRGANGIDGVLSTAVGAALAAPAGSRTVVLLGDVAFLHDTNGMLGLAGRHLDLTVLVVDNDGGAIFSFLPQAGVLDHDRFELLFGTPHGVDLAALATAHGLPVRVVETAGGLPALRDALGDCLAQGGVQVLVAHTDRGSNVAAHDAIHEAVHAAVADLL